MSTFNSTIAAVASLLVLLSACGDDTAEAPTDAGTEEVGSDTATEEVSSDAGADTAEEITIEMGDGIFAEGCPVPGRATAREIGDQNAHMEGPDALGGVGDFLLMNELSAFIIQGPELKSYYDYPGTPIDAVALEGCAQDGLERFSEMGFLIGEANVGDFAQSTLRIFKGESFELINDGSDGEAAVLRVSGVDDFFMLIESTLIRQSFEDGTPKGRSEPMGVAMHVDYILEPDSPVLRMELVAENQTDHSVPILLGSIVFFGDTTDTTHYSDMSLNVGPFGLEMAVPWLAAASEDGSLAIAVHQGNAGTVRISGVEALLDVDQFLQLPRLTPAGEAGDTRTAVFHMAVGGGDVNSAVRHLAAVNPMPAPALDHTLNPISGDVLEAETGDPIEGAQISIEIENQEGNWLLLDRLRSDEDGHFEGDASDLEADVFRVSVAATGRHRPPAVDLSADELEGLEFELGAPGFLHIRVRDEDGNDMPAKVFLWQDGRITNRIYMAAQDETHAIPPGTYEVSITRGLEYGPVDVAIEIIANETTQLRESLERVVDTTGYLSYDGHIHAGPSPDSSITIPMRLITLAADNVEVPLSTDHEAIVDWAWAVEETGLSDWIVTVLGSEITAGFPEHTIAFPFTEEPGRRGGIVDWHWRGIGEIYAAERERGAQVVQLNHARNGCNYMCIVDYNRMTGETNINDPTLFGLDEDMSLWSWDFDAIEYQNGHRSPIVDPENPTSTGTANDWWSFLNHGHRVTAIGVTDVHGLDARGTPITYFAAPTDDVTEFDEQMLVDAILDGQALVSTGAFARIEINGAGMGETVTDEDGEVDVYLHIEALPEIDVDHFKVFVNCVEVATVEATNPYEVVKYDGTTSIPVTEDAHVTVMGFGYEMLPRNMPQFNSARTPRFTTNAIYIDTDGNGEYDAPGGVECVISFDEEKRMNFAELRTADRLQNLAEDLARRNSLIDDDVHVDCGSLDFLSDVD
jgi:hypothetical protein